MQKTKKEDFRVEEELRIQKAKYEETKEDVFRRMQDVSREDYSSPLHTLIWVSRFKKQRLTASLIWEHFWMHSSATLTGAGR